MKSSRRSISIRADHPEDLRHQRLTRKYKGYEGFYGHMLYQDCTLLLPLRGKYKIEVLPQADDELMKILATAIGHGDPHDWLDHALGDFLRECAFGMVFGGSTSYEIEYLTKPSTSEEVSFRFRRIDYGTHIRRRGKDVQYLPARIAAEFDLPRFVDLDPASLVVFRLNRSRQREILRCTRFLHEAKDWHRQISALSEKARTGVPYDFSSHQEMMDLSLARATRPMGWDARGTFKKHQLEPYWVDRQIRFHAFRIELRDRILQVLNDALRTVGGRLGFEAEIVLRGVPTPEDVHSAQEELERGGGSLYRILDRFH